MKFRLQLLLESDTGEMVTTEEIVPWERHALQPEEIGLTMAEGKQILSQVQRVMVQEQVTAFVEEQSRCPDCGQLLTRKGQHSLVFRTVFGKLRLSSPRLYTCSCQQASQTSFSPLAPRLPERIAPELVYLETKFAALLSYGLSVDILGEILPIGDALNTRSLRRQVTDTAERMEGQRGEEQWAFIEGCQRDGDELPRPDPPLVVGLDGGFVHGQEKPSRREGWFEVIVGKSMPAEGPSKCLAFVQTYEEKPKRRLFELLKSQNMQMNQQVTFFTDGGEDIRELPLFLNPEAEHILDWFHVTMRLTVLGQTVKGLAGLEQTFEEEEQSEKFDLVWTEKRLEKRKWYLWHGNVYQALQMVERLEWDLEKWETGREKAAQLLKAVQDFGHYIEANQNAIPN